MPQNYYVLVADCLGFQNMNVNLPAEQLHSRVNQWLELFNNSVAITDKVIHSQLSSDTVFYLAEPTIDGLKSLIEISKYLLKEGVKASLPVRGAISYGEAHFAEASTYGPAVIRAYKLCESQLWIGIIVDNLLAEAKELLDFETLISYEVPMKTEEVKLWPTVIWDIPPYSNLYNYLIGHGLVVIGSAVVRSTRIKFQNTVDFSTYLTILKLLRSKFPEFQDPSKNYGNTPNELMAMFVNNYAHHYHNNPEEYTGWWPRAKKEALDDYVMVPART